MELSCRGDLTVATAAERLPDLLAALPESGDVALDLSGVDELDTAGLQILLVLRREAAGRSGRLHLAAVSEPVTRLLTLSGLDLRLEPVDALTEGDR